MNASLLMQLVMIALAGIIGLTYIEPTIADIKETQDSTYSYQLETQKVAAVNAALRDHVVTIDSIPNENARALETYLPDYVDQIEVTRDIKKIVESVGGILSALAYTEAENANATVVEQVIDEETGEVIETAPVGPTPVVPHIFTVTTEVTYTQLKQLIDAFAVNEYPLHIKDLTLTPDESGFVGAVFVLETYSRLYEESAVEDSSTNE